jgi:ribosomal protein L11 methyltransferase
VNYPDKDGSFDKAMISQMHQEAATTVARLETDEQSARKIASALDELIATDDIAVSLVDNGNRRWTLALHFPASTEEAMVLALVEAAAGADAAKALVFEPVAAKDWVRDSLAGLAPVTAGRFVIHGAHDRARVPVNRIGIEIEASLAFGTGHHGTTRGCLLALDATCRALSAHRRLHILDLGTGSAVLAIAAARALRQRVLATDIDAEAVRVARDNARFNGVGALIELAQADGVARKCILARAPFDLVFANILLGPLQRFAAPLRQLIAPGGRIILSGILKSQANAALAAYWPLTLERRIDLDGWTTLVLKRKS